MSNNPLNRYELPVRSPYRTRTNQKIVPQQIVFPETKEDPSHNPKNAEAPASDEPQIAEASRELPRARVQGQPTSFYRVNVKASPAQKPVEENKFFGNCPRCEWKGYLTFAAESQADVKLCSCQAEICPQCNGEGGSIISLESGNRAWKTCDCRKLARRMELYRAAHIPSRFADKTLDAFAPNDDSQAKARAHFYKLYYDPTSNRSFKPGDAGVLLMGSPGVGKTHLMVGFLRNLILERGIACRFQDFGLLLSDMRDGYTRDVPEQHILQPLVDIDVLLLDDLGKGRNSKWELGIIDTLISCRYNAGRTTLITTNYTLDPETTLRERSRGRGHIDSEEFLSRDTLRDRVGDRIYSRLHEMCRIFFVRGNDYRQILQKP